MAQLPHSVVFKKHINAELPMPYSTETSNKWRPETGYSHPIFSDMYYLVQRHPFPKYPFGNIFRPLDVPSWMANLIGLLIIAIFCILSKR